MALVIGPTDKAEQSQFADYLFQQQKQLTEFQGSDGAQVFVVADYLLEELENLSLPSRQISESELAKVLTPKGLNYYRALKAQCPEVFSFDGRLPALGTQSGTVLFHEWHLYDVSEILRQRTDQELSLQECFAMIGEVSGTVLKVKLELPNSDWKEIGQELTDRGVIGVSPLTRLTLGRDPDR
jgi:hypothetical protein